MPRQSAAGSVIERARSNAKLVEQLREALQDMRLDVLGHLDDAAGGLCCGKTGTVAMVYIEKGRPPERTGRSRKSSVRGARASRRAR